MRTAELAGLVGVKIDANLQEWDYGGYDGRTTAQIRADRPGWYLWRDGVIPGDADHPGESIAQVGARADAVIARVRPLLGDDGGADVALVAHGHLLRVLTARWLQLEPAGGRFFRLDTGTVSTLHSACSLTTLATPRAAVRAPDSAAGGHGGRHE